MSASKNLIEETNLSDAWCIALHRIVENRGHEITPLVLTLTGFNESDAFKAILNAKLEEKKMDDVQTVSETIFPQSLYEYYGKDRKKLYEVYKGNLPRIMAVNPSNRRGTYFQRLIAYEAGKSTINQLEIIIESLMSKKIKRRSKLQASIFDPTRDHTNGMFQGFPCLQHVTVSMSKNGGLILNSFYAIQYLFRRGYGNWLGLINLGKFLAQEVNVKFERFNCFIGVEHLDKLTTAEAKQFLSSVKFDSEQKLN